MGQPSEGGKRCRPRRTRATHGGMREFPRGQYSLMSLLTRTRRFVGNTPFHTKRSCVYTGKGAFKTVQKVSAVRAYLRTVRRTLPGVSAYSWRGQSPGVPDSEDLASVAEAAQCPFHRLLLHVQSLNQVLRRHGTAAESSEDLVAHGPG